MNFEIDNLEHFVLTEPYLEFLKNGGHLILKGTPRALGAESLLMPFMNSKEREWLSPDSHVMHGKSGQELLRLGDAHTRVTTLVSRSSGSVRYSKCEDAPDRLYMTIEMPPQVQTAKTSVN